MEYNFKVGQKVICIDDSLSSFQTSIGHNLYPLQKDKVYTIRWEGMWKHPGIKNSKSNYHVRLVEIVRKEQGLDVPYFAWRFRPLDDDPLKHFRKMLNPTPKVIRRYMKELKVLEKEKKKEKV